MPRQYAEEESDDRVGQDEANALPQLDESLTDVTQAQAGADLLDVSDALLLGRSEDFADPEEADRDWHEADAREQRDLSEVEALLAGDRIEADRREEQTESEHRDALHRRLRAETNERRERQDEHGEELRRPKLQRAFGDR